MPLLAQIPIDVSIREGGDAGQPVAAGEGPVAQIFHNLALRIIDLVDAKSTAQPALSIVN